MTNFGRKEFIEERNLGWALWSLGGKFGIMDTGRTDCAFDDFEGHQLDRQALDLLLRYCA